MSSPEALSLAQPGLEGEAGGINEKAWHRPGPSGVVV
jgi:hypothetical protein